MIALPIKNEKRGFDLAYCGIRLRSSVRGVQRNWFFLRAARRGHPKVSDCTPICGGSSAIIGAPSAASSKRVFGTWRRGAILHASLAENVLSGTNNAAPAAAMGGF